MAGGADTPLSQRIARVRAAAEERLARQRRARREGRRALDEELASHLSASVAEVTSGRYADLRLESQAVANQRRA